MNNERKIKLLNYLFPTDDVRKFVCNELFDELSLIIKPSLCISSKNLSNVIRKSNLNLVKKEVNLFLQNNIFYFDNLVRMYNENDTNKIVDNIVIAYVFYLSSSSVRYNSFDIFKDRRSICYAPISIVDMLE